MATLASVLESTSGMGISMMSVTLAFPLGTVDMVRAIRQGRSVPGFPGAFVCRAVAGERLFIDRMSVPSAELVSLDAGAIWLAAYGQPVPRGYRAVVLPRDHAERFRLLSVIAVLAPLVPTVEQLVREATMRHPGGPDAMCAQMHGLGDGSVKFSPLR